MSIRKPTEADVVKQCRDYLAIVGVFCWRQNQGAMTGEYKGRTRFLRFASAKGISDLIGILPAPRRGQLIAVECKQPGKHPTPDQRAFLSEISARGGLSLVIHSLKELEEALKLEGIAP